MLRPIACVIIVGSGMIIGGSLASHVLHGVMVSGGGG